jgi:lipoprotein-anchoring transpeptidase ErfK/SrfK
MEKANRTPPPHSLSRRSFLKLGGLGLAGLFLPPLRTSSISPLPLAHSSHAWVGSPSCWQALSEPLEELPLQGRVQDVFITLFEQPSFEAQRVRFLWKDAVINLTGVSLREETDSHNKVWYQVGSEGYVHSGAVQPVSTTLNQPVLDLPEGGALAEVTVPYTDSHWNPSQDDYVAYRFYYATTHWVTHLKYSPKGEPWYAVLDDKWEYIFYVPAEHLRILPESELTPLSPDMPSALKRLEVLIPEQAVIAYENDQPVFMARMASGGRFRDGDFSTQPGRFMTFHKRASRHMAAGNLAAGGYDLPGVPWICYFTESGISFHGTYWHNNYGRPRSHGCVNLTPKAAKWVYRWTMPVVPPAEISAYERFGTLIDIKDKQTWWDESS